MTDFVSALEAPHDGGPSAVAADFDARSAGYSNNQLWHRAYADGLTAHSRIRLGDRVLDAGVGTGFAAIAASTRVTPRDRVDAARR